MSEPLFRQNLRLFGQNGRFDLMLKDGLNANILPFAEQSPALLALPGFCESHAQLFSGGAALKQLSLAHVHDAETLHNVLVPFVKSTPTDEIVCAYAANYDLLGAKQPDLDANLPNRPLCINATDFHCSWANTTALQAAGILHGTDTGAEVVIGPDGLAVGELRKFAAMDLVRWLTPSGGHETLGLSALEPDTVTPAQRTRDKATLLRAMRERLRHGIASVVNMDGALYLADLQTEMAAEG